MMYTDVRCWSCARLSVLSDCPRYHQKKKELKEQQDKVRVLRKKWPGNPAENWQQIAIK